MKNKTTIFKHFIYWIMVKGLNTPTKNILSREMRFHFHRQKVRYQRLNKIVCIIWNLWAVYLHYPSNSVVYILNPRQLLILVSFPHSKAQRAFLSPGHSRQMFSFLRLLSLSLRIWKKPFELHLIPERHSFSMFLHIFKYNQNLF